MGGAAGAHTHGCEGAVAGAAVGASTHVAGCGCDCVLHSDGSGWDGQPHEGVDANRLQAVSRWQRTANNKHTVHTRVGDTDTAGVCMQASHKTVPATEEHASQDREHRVELHG